MTKQTQQQEPDNWWQSLLLVAIFATLCFLLSGCKTAKYTEKEYIYKTDSVVMYDTVYAEHHLIRYDTTYVYDTYKETYTIGKVDTIHQYRVDTVKVLTTTYVYKEKREEATDSAVHIKVDSQKGAATEVRAVEKVVEKPIPLWKKALVVLALVLVAGIFYVAGTWKPFSK